MQQEINILSVIPRPELEHYDYHKLDRTRWVALGDAESWLHIGLKAFFVKKHAQYRSVKDCLAESAKQGHPIALAMVLCELGYEDKGLELLSASAKRGHPIGNSAIRVANCTANALVAGHNMKKENYDDAVRFARVAHDRGYCMGARILSACYKHGLGVAQNLKESKRLIRIAALQGDAPALKIMYEHYDNKDDTEGNALMKGYYANLYVFETCDSEFARRLETSLSPVCRISRYF